MFVIAVGTFSGGLMLYGPFPSEELTRDYAHHNDQMDLSDVHWEVIEVEDAEDVRSGTEEEDEPCKMFLDAVLHDAEKAKREEESK
jgi:hypothetical protein